MSNEVLWAETFGDDYTVRNDRDYDPRRTFFMELFYKCQIGNVLEVGCNTGMNLDLIAQALPSEHYAWGCDVNRRALNTLHIRHKELNGVYASGFDLPFRDDYFDLVFTCGVLIHQKPEEVETMMQEIIRVSGRYVLAMEYDSPQFEEIPYSNQKESLFKGPYGEIYEKRYGLRLIETRKLGKEDGFDNVTSWLFAKY